MPIRVGDTLNRGLKMIETTVDYWTCIDLAQALEQTMRNDLWSTAERIAETASRITKKPEELVAAIKKFDVRKAALDAAEGVTQTTSTDTTHFSKAG
jgi:16S rRNA C1402 (ribose-2'-O) methylase RsmI